MRLHYSGPPITVFHTLSLSRSIVINSRRRSQELSLRPGLEGYFEIYRDVYYEKIVGEGRAFF